MHKPHAAQPLPQKPLLMHQLQELWMPMEQNGPGAPHLPGQTWFHAWVWLPGYVDESTQPSL